MYMYTSIYTKLCAHMFSVTDKMTMNNNGPSTSILERRKDRHLQPHL